MKLRKNVRSLTRDEIDRFVAGCLTLKRAGRYEKFVHWHHQVMIPTVMPNEPHDPNYRNGAHLGPAFLPWHREFLMQFESELQSVDATLVVPYWDWTEDAVDPKNSPVWADNFMGGDGVQDDYWRVAKGPFAYSAGNWPVPSYPEDGFPEQGLKRQFGLNIGSLPTSADLAMAMRERLYDTPPYDSGPYTRGFRNRLEGWITQRGDPQVTTPGSQLHNRVHLWIGGNMLAMTSPEDPVFFLHHCFIDKVWADWQAEMAQGNAQWAPHYAPLQNGPVGHNYDDVLKPWQRRIRDVMDITELGYRYEQPPSLTVVRERFNKSPFSE
ncbi:tyrosinase family protein [Pseudomonas mandelii]|uniref:tyrosinase family protein n=1 Tax=Pseudomonas mandelii TaxID=75612 RepID=UPI00209D7D48|nr:tyrosinase family protein [Pseudomonas mandelii]MCO8310259.1 tyrosinase family protein [Pseudomonas mandelii]